jgi:hypothetical protein
MMARVFAKLVVVLLMIAVCVTPETGFSETRRAVIVGIDDYTVPGVQPVPRGAARDPRSWRNLGGAVNDATRIKEILIARFGFNASDIEFLSDQQATRQAIIDAINRQLVDKSAAGDVAFFYYSGHGSRVRNSLSVEPDKLDESLVPADAATGVRDIRDKELRDLFNAVLDKGVNLTVVIDSCHSGSITRGAAGTPIDAVRRLAIDPRDVKDASRAPGLWQRGALVISAAQQDQLAHETEDAFGIQGGVFTISLTQALQASEPDEPVQNLFRRVKALMKASGKIQEPVLEGSEERKQQNLLGGEGTGVTGRTMAAIQSVDGESVVLQEGLAAGLTAGTELIRVGAAEPRLAITDVAGLVNSRASVISGKPTDIKPGDLYMVDNWAPPDVPSLRVWMPVSGLSSQALIQLANDLARLAKQRGFAWVTDPTEQTPTHVIFFDGRCWQLDSPTAELTTLGATPTAAQIGDHLLPSANSNVRLFLSLPITKSLHRPIHLGAGTNNSAVEPTQDRSVADYHLVGREEGGRLMYAWVRPWLAGQSETTLPVRTDWVALSAPIKRTSDRLETYALRLGRIRAWLELQGPPGTRPFPYQLTLKRDDTDAFLADGTVYDGESFQLALQRNAARVSKGRSHYVYVFAIDSQGRSQLLFPSLASVENRFPPEQDPKAKREHYVLEGAGFDIAPPFGTDTFVLIATSEQLPDPTVLNSAGVRTRSATTGDNPLQDLLANVGARTRGFRQRPVPTDWSIQRISVQSRQKHE